VLPAISLLTGIRVEFVGRQVQIAKTNIQSHLCCLCSVVHPWKVVVSTYSLWVVPRRSQLFALESKQAKLRSQGLLADLLLNPDMVAANYNSRTVPYCWAMATEHSNRL